MGMAVVAALWGVVARAAVPVPVGGAADAGGDVHPHPDTTAYAPLELLQRLAQEVARSTPSPRSSRRRGRDSSAGSPGATPGPGSSRSLALAVIGGGRAARHAPRDLPVERDAALAAALPRACPAPSWRRASATASASPTRGRAPGATPGSGTGTRASRRSSGGTSTRTRSRAELETLSARHARGRLHRPRDLLGRAPSRSRGSLLQRRRRSAAMTSTIQPPLLAWAWRIAVGDPAEEPRIAAHHRWLRGQPRPGGRRAALARPARRVGARLVAEVRPGLGLAGSRQLGLPAARGAQPPARLGRAARSATRGGPVLCEVVTNVLWGLSLLAMGEPLDHAGARRAAAGTSGAGCSSTRSSPGGERPAVKTWAALAPLALPDLPEEIGRRLVEEHLLDRASSGWRCRRRRWPRPSRASSPTAGRAGSAATGVGRPGSTPPG